MPLVDSLIITPEILKLIAESDEFKGSWQALGKIAPDRLNALKRNATIESIGSSTRIEGAKLSDTEVEELLGKLEMKQFATRDEQEVAGYSEVMNLMFDSYDSITISENHIRQLHRILLQYSDKDQWHRGNYKTAPNHVAAFDAAGKMVGIVFETASPFDTPFKMEELIQWTKSSFDEGLLHPLLITAVFVVSFLAIHPFSDGNGRLSHVLTTWLLLRSGYSYIPYTSLEAVIEQNKESYYLALRRTQATITGEKPDWQPWIIFFLKALQQQRQKLMSRLQQEKMLWLDLPKLSLEILSLTKQRGRITISEMVTLTGTNRNTIKKHLSALAGSKHLLQKGTGRGAWYQLS